MDLKKIGCTIHTGICWALKPCACLTKCLVCLMQMQRRRQEAGTGTG